MGAANCKSPILAGTPIQPGGHLCPISLSLALAPENVSAPRVLTFLKLAVSPNSVSSKRLAGVAGERGSEELEEILADMRVEAVLGELQHRLARVE